MAEVPEVIRSACLRPGMWTRKGSFDEVAALVVGYDAALDGGPLHGFREWLIVRLGDGNNLAWPGLVELIAADREPIATLLARLEEFYRERSAPEGMRLIFLEYEGWLRRQNWYDKKSPSYLAVPWAKPRKRR